MNAYKFNSTASITLRLAISTSLGISYYNVYNIVKDINNTIIHTKDGKKYLIQLTEIKDNEHKRPETKGIS